MLTNIAIALFAASFASILTLLASQRFGGSDVMISPSDQPGNVQHSETLIVGSGADKDSAAAALNANQLQQILDDASDERAQLSESLLIVTRQLDELKAEIENLDSQTSLASAVTDSDAESVTESDDTVEEQNFSEALGARSGRGTREERRFQSLLAAGVDEQTANDLQARTDQYQLSRLELLDQAAREGWSNSDQLDERLEDLDEDRVDFREELGDVAYDRYLFEAGIPNRVRIESIINGSAADLAGLQRGDVMSSYADEQVFRVQELQNATQSGERGQYVQVIIERDGELLVTDLPRGPLGVTLDAFRLQP